MAVVKNVGADGFLVCGTCNRSVHKSVPKCSHCGARVEKSSNPDLEAKLRKQLAEGETRLAVLDARLAKLRADESTHPVTISKASLESRIAELDDELDDMARVHMTTSARPMTHHEARRVVKHQPGRGQRLHAEIKAVYKRLTEITNPLEHSSRRADLQSEMDTAVADHAAKRGISVDKARIEFIVTPRGRELYSAIDAEAMGRGDAYRKAVASRPPAPAHVEKRGVALELDQAIAKHATEHGVSTRDATAAVLSTPNGRRLYNAVEVAKHRGGV